MARPLKSDFPQPAAPPLAIEPRTPEQRRAERRANRQARRRIAAQRLAARRRAAMLEDSERELRRRERLVARWFGRAPSELPLLVMDARYWDALRCGWDALGRDADGRPGGEPAPWWDWWCGLHHTQRRQLVELSRRVGVRGVYRRRNHCRN